MSMDAGLFAPVWAGTTVAALTSDEAFLQALLDAEAALARAQARLGLVPADAAAAITAAARAERVDLAEVARRARDTGNPVLPLVRELRAAAGDAAAGSVHRGATSQDILDTGLMLLSVRVLQAIHWDLQFTGAELARLAERHRDTPAVARTLTQHAVPTTFGLRAAGWCSLVSVAAERVMALADTLPVSLGGAAGTMAAYVGSASDPDGLADGLVAAYANETGLAEQVIPWHVLRVPVADLGATLALVTGALGKFALDVQEGSRTEVGELAEPAAPGRGASSAMPHKRNPVLATLILSAALQVPDVAATLARSLIAGDERPAGAWHAEWAPLRDCLRLAGGAAHAAVELARGLVVFPDRLRANLDLTGTDVVSERVAAVLAGLLGAEAGSVPDPVAALRDHLTGPEVDAVLDPLNYLGAAPHLVDRALRARGWRGQDPGRGA